MKKTNYEIHLKTQAQYDGSVTVTLEFPQGLEWQRLILANLKPAQVGPFMRSVKLVKPKRNYLYRARRVL